MNKSFDNFAKAIAEPSPDALKYREVTRREQAESYLRQSEQRFRDLFDHSADAIFVEDFEGNILDVNETACRLHGRSRHQLLGKNALDLAPENHRTQVKERLSLLVSGAATTVEGFVWPADGRRIPVEIRTTHIDFCGKPALLLHVRDVTERKKTDEAMQALVKGAGADVGEKFFQSLVRELAGVLGVRYALVGEIIPHRRDRIRTVAVWANGSPAENIEYDLAKTPCENVVGKSLCFYRQGVQESFPEDHLLVQMGVQGYLGAPLFDSTGAPLGLLVVLHDQPLTESDLAKSLLTIFASRAGAELERLRATQALARRERQLRRHNDVLMSLARHEDLLTDDLAQCLRNFTETAARTLHVERANIWFLQENDSVLRCEDHFTFSQGEHSVGMELRRDDFPSYFAEMQGRTLIAIHNIASDPVCRELADIYLAQGVAAMMDAPIRVRGRVVGIMCHEHVGSTRRWSEEEQSFVIALATLLSVALEARARKHAEEQRSLIERKLLESQKLESLGVLAGGIAHDFNNLLQGILGNVSLSQRELPEKSRVRDFLKRIEQASEHASELCQHMLSYAGQRQFLVSRVDLNQLVRDSLPLAKLANRKTTRLDFQPEAGRSEIAADATQIRQVLLNLVTNASEAIGPQPGIIFIRTGVRKVDRLFLSGTVLSNDLPEGDYIYLEVDDSGCGMSRETMARIFDPFFTTKPTGTGLGLAAVLGIVRAHKGTMKVESQAGHGSRFIIIFPAAAPSPERGSVTRSNSDSDNSAATHRVAPRKGKAARVRKTSQKDASPLPERKRKTSSARRAKKTISSPPQKKRP